MQVCLGDAGPCLLLLLCWFLPDGKLASTWDLFEGSLCYMFSPVSVYACVIKEGGVVREYVCSCADTWADMAIYYSTPLGSISW